MPLMMEEEMEVDIDDLFGDGAGLAMPPRPPSKELYQRIDELRASGCCQSIAWSKWGSIASIAPNGATLELRNLRCSPENGDWALSEPTLTHQLSNELDGGPLKHLCWGPSGSELAVIDSVGRITILSLFSSLNKPTLSRQCQVDPVDDLHAVVGCYWLNLAPYPANRPTILNGPAIKEGSAYKYEASQAPVLGPCHPNHSKSAFVCITTNGILRVLWPQNTGKWYECHTELESIVSSDDLITHASICSDKTGTLLIAFATTSKQLRTVRALIDWGLPKIPDKMPVAALPLNPSVKTRHLAITSWLHDVPSETINASQLESSMTELTHLEFLPPCFDSNNQMTPPTVVAIRSYLPPLTTQYNQTVHTTIDRWEVHEKQQAVHSAFEQLSSRRNSVGSQPGNVVFLKKLESFTVNKIVLSMQPINLGRIICFAYSDSSVDYRDRITMTETFNDNDLNRVWHLSQIGFSYIEDESCLQAAFSPSFCSLVQIRNDGKIKWKPLEYHINDIGSTMEDPQYAAMIAALALSCSTAVMTSANHDDLIAIAHNHLKSNFAYDWLIELSRVFKITVDYSEEQHYDLLIRNTTIQLCLSIQNSLGFQGENSSRSFGGKFAWIVLQLRNIVVLVTMAANMKVPNLANDKTSPLEDPEVINALAGSVHWIIDLMAWLTDTLLTLPSTLPPNISLTNASNLSLPDLLNHLQATNTISLHLLLSSPTRGFLTAICRRLAHLDYIARKAIAQPGQGQSNNSPNTNNPNNPNQHINPNQQHPSSISPALRAAYYQIATLTANTIIRTKTFETLLSSLTTSIKTAYSTANPSLSGSPAAEKARNALEIKMLFGGEIPAAFKPVIIELFSTLLPALREEIDPGRLFFGDFSILEVDEDENSMRLRKSKGMTIDCFRKTWLKSPPKSFHPASSSGDRNGNHAHALDQTTPKNPTRWRRCARCAAVMEDVLSNRHALQWLAMQQRRCFCSGYWDTINFGDSVS
ncbi:hypothetical protein B7463_g2798, partial [Scytalidium lignicola]